MYFVLVAFVLCLIYLLSRVLLPLFFIGERGGLARIFPSFAFLFFASIAATALSLSIPDPFLANRALHGLAGGFMAFFACFLAVRDSRLSLTRFQFFVIAALIVTALGVANELVEFVGQAYFGFVFAETITDTWLDLLSNSIGILFGALCFVPFAGKKV